MWRPPLSKPLYSLGLAHAFSPDRSKEHWNVIPDSLSVKRNLAERCLVSFAGFRVIEGAASSGGSPRSSSAYTR
jgi:hypothetical protein